MLKILKFQTFNENIMDKFKSLFKSTPKKAERTLMDTLNEHEIFVEVQDEYHYKFYYIPDNNQSKKRLLARIFKIKDKYGTDTLKLYFYLYDMDFKNKKKRAMKTLDPDPEVAKELENQPVVPYYKLAEENDDAEDLIVVFITFWIYQTTTGQRRQKFIEMISAKGYDLETIKNKKPIPFKDALTAKN